MKNNIKKLRDYRNTHRIELMQLKTMRDLRDIDGNSEEVALLDCLISERVEYIEKIQSEIAIASGKAVAWSATFSFSSPCLPCLALPSPSQAGNSAGLVILKCACVRLNLWTLNHRKRNMTNEEIKNLLMRFNDLCIIMKHRALSEHEEMAMIEIEEKLDALP
jgi:hypothetical protein